VYQVLHSRQAGQLHIINCNNNLDYPSGETLSLVCIVLSLVHEYHFRLCFFPCSVIADAASKRFVRTRVATALNGATRICTINSHSTIGFSAAISRNLAARHGHFDEVQSASASASASSELQLVQHHQRLLLLRNFN